MLLESAICYKVVYIVAYAVVLVVTVYAEYLRVNCLTYKKHKCYYNASDYGVFH